MLQDYVPVLRHALVAVGFATVTMLANISARPRQAALRQQRLRLRMRCHPGSRPPAALQREVLLVAMLFILFDIEVVFMYPWAVIFEK